MAPPCLDFIPMYENAVILGAIGQLHCEMHPNVMSDKIDKFLISL